MDTPRTGSPLRLDLASGHQAQDLVAPTYGQGCVTDLLPAALGLSDGSMLPEPFGSGPNVLLVLDGLGWLQLQDYAHLMPTIASMPGGPITTVAPSTTAAALTSITTSLAPGEHGVVGYRMMIDGEVFNSLRWSTTDRADCRQTVPPEMIQPYEPFLGHRVSLVTKADFRTTGFSRAHLRGGNLVGYRTTSVLVHEVARLAAEGEPVIYAYYDGVDKVAHEYGLRSEYEGELAFVDRLVADLLEALPAGARLLITADHGQVDCGHGNQPLHPEVLAMTHTLSGEARFRWLHADDDDIEELVELAAHYHGDLAWVFTRDEMIERGWFGSVISPEVEARLGDVALLAREPTGFEDPADSGPFELIGRHGSLTAAEMLVPCVGTSV